MSSKDQICRYTGTEPSPKGFGYCAHLQPVGTRMQGTDGNLWIVKEISNGSRRWVKVNEKESKKEDTRTLAFLENLRFLRY